MDYNQTFEKYNEIMILASSKRKTIDSMSVDESAQVEEFLNYQINQINVILEEIDYILSNYHNLQIEIGPHELNGMEQDLEALKKEYMGLIG